MVKSWENEKHCCLTSSSLKSINEKNEKHWKHCCLTSFSFKLINEKNEKHWKYCCLITMAPQKLWKKTNSCHICFKELK